MIKTALMFAASLIFIVSTHASDEPEKAPVALERLLHGEWKGPPCAGDFTFRADGSFERRHYTPGNNKLSGTWQVRWNALPPTLVLICTTSDDPDRLPVGKTWEVKLIQLDDEILAHQSSENRPERLVRYSRAKK